MPNATAQSSLQLDMDDLPMMPQKRRLSANAWQMVWSLQLMNPLRAPHTLDRFVKQFNDEHRVFGAKPRTTTRICLSVTAENMDDTAMAAEVFTVICAMEEQYGPVSLIENRSADHWPLYKVRAQKAG